MKLMGLLFLAIVGASHLADAGEASMDLVKDYSTRDALRKEHSLNVFRDTRGIEADSKVLKNAFAQGDEMILKVELKKPSDLKAHFPDSEKEKWLRSETLTDEINLAKEQHAYNLSMISSKDPRVVEKYKKLSEESKKHLDELMRRYLNATPGTEYRVTFKVGEKGASRNAEDEARHLIEQYQQRGFRVTSIDRVPAKSVLKIEQAIAKGARGVKSASKGLVGVAAAGSLAIGMAESANASTRVESAPYHPAMKGLGSQGTK